MLPSNFTLNCFEKLKCYIPSANLPRYSLNLSSTAIKYPRK